jgi:hypothetical protein
LSFGPLWGLRDSLDPMVSSDPTRAVVIENMHPVELDKPSAFVGRPGCDQAGAQGGASNKRTHQLIYQFTKLAGTEYTVRIVGGQGLQTYDWSSETWTTVVSVANLTTNSITLSETARCYAVTYTDKMVISDGTNTPFMWDGTSGAGGLTKLTNAPVFFGPLRIYYAKLAGFKNTERNTFVWSEENDATIGYEAGGYNNAWTLAQTEQEGFFGMAALDDALVMLRAYSGTAVYGAVTPAFSSTGTREAVSQTVGTTSPDGICIHNGNVFFPDAQGRPQAIVGGKVLDPPFWNDIRETILGIDTSLLSSAMTIYDPGTRLVLFCYAETGQTDLSMMLAVNPSKMVPVAVWRGFTFQYIAVVKNGSGVPTIMHGDSLGYTYDHGHPDGVLWDDELNAGTQAIRHRVEGPHLGTDARYEKRYGRADLLMRADSDVTALYYSYTTPYGLSTPLLGTVTGNAARWNQVLWDQFEWAGPTTERKKPFGMNGLGRWVRPRVTHEIAGERFGFEHLSVDWTPAGDHPLAP